MGVFDKVKKTVKSIAKNPTNLRNYGDLGLETLTLGQVDTHGVNGVGSLQDILLGKKKEDIKPDEITGLIRNTQAKGINDLNSALDTPAESIVRQGAETQKKSILTQAQDARRNAQRLFAQRGLSGTSLGLAADRSIARETDKDIASVNASLPGQIRDQKLRDASTRIGVGGVNMNGMNFNSIEGQRDGGILGYASALAPLFGAGAGAYKDYQAGKMYSRGP